MKSERWTDNCRRRFLQTFTVNVALLGCRGKYNIAFHVDGSVEEFYCCVSLMFSAIRVLERFVLLASGNPSLRYIDVDMLQRKHHSRVASLKNVMSTSASMYINVNVRRTKPLYI